MDEQSFCLDKAATSATVTARLAIFAAGPERADEGGGPTSGRLWIKQLSRRREDDFGAGRADGEIERGVRSEDFSQAFVLFGRGEERQEPAASRSEELSSERAFLATGLVHA